MIKNIRVVVTSLLSVLCLQTSICQEEDTLIVASASKVLVEMVSIVSGDLVDVQFLKVNLIPSGVSNAYSMSSSDNEILRNVDLFFHKKSEMTDWVWSWANEMQADVSFIDVILGHKQIFSDMSPILGSHKELVYIENIKDALIKVAPHYREEFEFNAGVYSQQIEGLYDKYEELMDSVGKENKWVVMELFREIERKNVSKALSPIAFHRNRIVILEEAITQLPYELAKQELEEKRFFKKDTFRLRRRTELTIISVLVCAMFFLFGRWSKRLF